MASGESRGAGAGGTVLPGILLGLGLGGFVDGIVLHQILQWHHMLSGERGDEPLDTVAGLEANTVGDGVFHAATWTLVVLGVVLLYRRLGGADARRPSLVPFAGLLLAGWGIFNLVEGLVDHHLLELHHVRDDVDDPLPWDLAFLASGVVLIGAGWWLARRPAAPP
jgi:uncharacterized membrane protein